MWLSVREEPLFFAVHRVRAGGPVEFPPLLIAALV
jgi:hypothetical protein